MYYVLAVCLFGVNAKKYTVFSDRSVSNGNIRERGCKEIEALAEAISFT